MGAERARRPLLAALLLLLPATAGAADGDADHLEGTPEELEGWLAIQEARFVRARAIGERLLGGDPESHVGHFVLGVALHRGEADLARAARELELARAGFERRHPLVESAATGDQLDDVPWRWHQAMLHELLVVLGAMDRPAEQLRVIDAHNRLYAPALLAHKIWPLMKLRRYDEARAAAQAAMTSGVPGARKYARADLCGAESESGDRQRAYDACVEATHDFRETPMGRSGQLEFSNAADAALEVFRFDDAERFLRESMLRPNTVLWVNPFQQAAELLLSEGRMPEAIDAMRGAQDLRVGRPAWVDQFDRAKFDGTLAKLFLLVGVIDHAVAAAERAIERPDRQGHASGTATQAEAASSIVLAVVLRERAERARERAASAPLWQSLRLRVAAAWDQLRAWRAERAATVALADEDFLVRSLRPYYLGILLPPWLLPEVVDAIGGGVARAGLARARAADPHPVAATYFDALDAEAEHDRGECAAAAAKAGAALPRLPVAEVLLRARMEVIQASCALRRGDLSAATPHLLAVLARDPDLLRRLRIALPVAFTVDDSGLARTARAMLARSPRFHDAGAGAPFTLSISGGSHPRACLAGPVHEQLACATVNLPDDVRDATGARLLVEELHGAAFAVKADLTQADLTSLDGSPTAARADRQVQSVLDRLALPLP